MRLGQGEGRGGSSDSGRYCCIPPCHRNGHWSSQGSSRNSGCSQNTDSPFYSFFLSFSPPLEAVTCRPCWCRRSLGTVPILRPGSPRVTPGGISLFSSIALAAGGTAMGAPQPSAGGELLLSLPSGPHRGDRRAVGDAVTSPFLSLSPSPSSSLPPPGAQHETRQSQRIKTP